MRPIHPGRILKREMSARGLSANKLSLSLRVPSGLIARYFGNSAQFWINLQSRYDLAVVEQNIGDKVIAEVEQAEM